MRGRATTWSDATIAPNGDIVGETFESRPRTSTCTWSRPRPTPSPARSSTARSPASSPARPCRRRASRSPCRATSPVAAHSASTSPPAPTALTASRRLQATTPSPSRPMCALIDGTSKCHSTKSAVVDDALDPVTVDAIELQGELTVAVSPNPQHVTLKADPKSGDITPAPVTVTVKITNTGAKPVTDVTAPDKLVVGYSDPNDVHVDKVAFRLKKGAGPKPKARAGHAQAGQERPGHLCLRGAGRRQVLGRGARPRRELARAHHQRDSARPPSSSGRRCSR